MRFLNFWVGGTGMAVASALSAAQEAVQFGQVQVPIC